MAFGERLLSSKDDRCMMDGTPNSPWNFYCFGFFTHIALNRLLSQVYRAHIAGLSSSIPQVSPTRISWRLGSVYYQLRTIDAWWREPPILPGIFTVLVSSLTSPWIDCCRRSIVLISQGRPNQHLRWDQPEYHEVRACVHYLTRLT